MDTTPSTNASAAPTETTTPYCIRSIATTGRATRATRATLATLATRAINHP